MAKIITSKMDEKLGQIKGNIEDFHGYFKNNFERSNRFRRFVFESTLSDEKRAYLSEMGLPELEFNALESDLSRLLGEYSKNEPSLTITSRATDKNVNNHNLIDFLEKHVYQILFDANENSLQYQILRDTLSGGFSAFKVLVRYESPMSFNQEIYLERFFDPTLCVFDKSARNSHKGDGKYSAELFPRTFDQLKEEYGSSITDSLGKATSSIGDFSWSYTNERGDKLALIADYYEKRDEIVKIVNVAGPDGGPNHSMVEKDYEAFVELWNKTRFEQAPVVIGKPKKAHIQTVDRYIICGGKIIENEKTGWKYLPHIFVDGNSEILRKGASGQSYQQTRPFLYNAEGIQNLKNYAGISLANELQNVAQHKIMMPVEGIPAQYTDPLKDLQNPAVVLYNQFCLDNPDKPVNPPAAFPRSPIPQEITSTFAMADGMSRAILGSFESMMGIPGNPASGEAIKTASLLSNPVSDPYLFRSMEAMTQAGIVILDLIPRYMRTPRSIPIIDKKGERSFVNINTSDKDAIQLDYESDSLNINIKSGVSFSVQKEMAFNTIVKMMQISPVIMELMTKNSEGIRILLDNLDLRGADEIKGLVEEFMKEQKEKEAKAQQMAQQQMAMEMEKLKIMQQNNPVEIKKAELALKAKKDSAEIGIKKEQLGIEMALAQSEIKNQDIENYLRAKEIEARNARTHVDAMAKERGHTHKMAIDLINIKNKHGKPLSVEIDQ